MYKTAGVCFPVCTAFNDRFTDIPEVNNSTVLASAIPKASGTSIPKGGKIPPKVSLGDIL